MNRIETYSRKATWPVAIALAAFIVAGCGSSSDSAPASTTPVVDPVGAVCAGAECVNLGTASNYVILAKDGGITSDVTSPSMVTGNVGMNAVASGITGFSLVMDPSNQFATSAQVIGGGRVYASNYEPPTPAALTQAIADTGAAITSIGSKANSGPSFLNAHAGILGGETLPPGVYEWTSGGVSVAAASTVTLSGSATDVWVFRIVGGITMNPGSSVTLTGGALPQNVFWRTSDVVALDTTANLKGIVLSGSSVTMENGASVTGRLLATTAVTLIGNAVTRPPL
jgi:hypothetical protein